MTKMQLIKEIDAEYKRLIQEGIRPSFAHQAALIHGLQLITEEIENG